MRYLSKSPASDIINNNLKYPKDSEKIVTLLKAEQKGFCAYTEKYLTPLEAVEIEHFDPRIKPTPQDSYWNWYAAIRFVNMRRPRKETFHKYEPFVLPYSEKAKEKIFYADFTFHGKDEEGKNLVKLLGLDKYELSDEIKNNIESVKDLRQMCGDDELFKQKLKKDPRYLSFATAIFCELGIEVQPIIDELANIL